jgi:hypothetical protein
MAKKTKRITEFVIFNQLNKRWLATNKAYPMIRGYGISSSNALSRLRLITEETVKLMKGISP